VLTEAAVPPVAFFLAAVTAPTVLALVPGVRVESVPALIAPRVLSANAIESIPEAFVKGLQSNLEVLNSL